MLKNKRQRLALIHIAKEQLGLADEEYRSLLLKVAGVGSAKEIDSDGQFKALMVAFKDLGFKDKKAQDVDFKNKRSGGGAGRITSRQEYYIRGLWNLCMEKSRSDESLDAFVKRVTGVPFLHWITVQDASKVIVALQKIALANGYNPEHRD